jgi:hypothetical protein
MHKTSMISLIIDLRSVASTFLSSSNVVLIDELFFAGCRSKQGSATLDAYLSQKHDKLLAKLLPPETYCKKSSLAIVDGFAVEITDAQVTSRLDIAWMHVQPLYTHTVTSTYI